MARITFLESNNKTSWRASFYNEAEKNPGPPRKSITLLQSRQNLFAVASILDPPTNLCWRNGFRKKNYFRFEKQWFFSFWAWPNLPQLEIKSHQNLMKNRTAPTMQGFMHDCFPKHEKAKEIIHLWAFVLPCPLQQRPIPLDSTWSFASGAL